MGFFVSKDSVFNYDPFLLLFNGFEEKHTKSTKEILSRGGDKHVRDFPPLSLHYFAAGQKNDHSKQVGKGPGLCHIGLFQP